MHPILRTGSGVLLYTAVWVLFGAMFAVMLRASGHMSWTESAMIATPVIVILALGCLAPWFSSRALPLSSTPLWKVISTHILTGMCISAIALAPARLVAAASRASFPNLSSRVHSAMPVLAPMALVIYLLSVALHYALHAVESSRQAELLSREAELKALKAQVNPHFLFNSLNSISALTSLDPAKARDMCVRLSEFLRNSLRLGERTSIPFAEELALTRTYLDVEQVRFGARLRTRQDFEPACTDCEVPPLLVQPLVENSIKHGIATLVEGGEITMTGRRMRDFVRITIENPFDPEAPETRRNGFGLASVRNRLYARYGGAAKLEIQVDESRYRVVLTIPCDSPLEKT